MAIPVSQAELHTLPAENGRTRQHARPELHRENGNGQYIV